MRDAIEFVGARARELILWTSRQARSAIVSVWAVARCKCISVSWAFVPRSRRPAIGLDTNQAEGEPKKVEGIPPMLYFLEG